MMSPCAMKRGERPVGPPPCGRNVSRAACLPRIGTGGWRRRARRGCQCCWRVGKGKVETCLLVSNSGGTSYSSTAHKSEVARQAAQPHSCSFLHTSGSRARWKKRWLRRLAVVSLPASKIFIVSLTALVRSTSSCLTSSLRKQYCSPFFAFS